MNLNNKCSFITILLFTILYVKLNYAFNEQTSKNQRLLLRCKKKCQNNSKKLKKFCKKCPSLDMLNKNKTFESNKIYENNIFFKNKNSTMKLLSNEKTLDEINYTNNKIKHFIIIRFYSDNMMEKEKMFNYTFLHNAINDFKKFTLKSLENQTNKSFEIIIKINNELPGDSKAISELKQIESPIKINVIRSNLTDKYIINNTKEAKFVITTRIDHDDLIYNDAVKDIQNKCNINIPLYYNGYINGITMINNDIKNCYKFYGHYNNKGTISTFQSLILNKNLYKGYLSIYSLGPHHNQINKFIEYYKGFEYNKSFFNINKLENSFIYVKHDFNHSSHYNPKLKTNWHRSKVKVEKDKNWFINRFGNFIEY
ncbi:hypothetical protein LY90DRAFT_513662 [Neocallimastix californiae]|uniref:Glycosyltransferase 2-like domain-containing protein n=1 Tax=Neocallimastix californiae TaxID=1754190 RepID=A0A1Y2AWW7_9FUNG|nr:hypothetical protein LY90DRAFT_513662 [Neocallimastix californiae]|eukprot:ORY26727.1 hypothetical protein LY90DRAFT_513662 [Neocallimastix californiae]